MSSVPRVKIVLDTSVLLMAFGNPGSFLDRLLRLALSRRQVTLFISPEIIQEFSDKLEFKFMLPRPDVVAVVASLSPICSIITPSQRLKVVKDDPDDNKILECAVQAKADLIITSDKHLLKLKRYEDTKIAHPSMLKYWFT